jgi:hypothetical protein
MSSDERLLEDVRIHIKQHEVEDSKNSDSSSKDDPNRTEMPWDGKREDFVWKIHKDCLEKSSSYDAASRSAKKKYTRYALPGVVVPIIMSVVSPHLPQDYNYIDGIALAGIAVLNGLNTFHNWGKKFTSFNEFAGKYADLAGYIDVEMSKPKRYRVALDVFLERVTTKKAFLDGNAPFL